MRIGCGIAGVAIAVTACGSSAAAPTTTRTDAVRPPAVARCGPAGARTLAVDARARIYITGGAVYGCASGGHAHLLGQSGLARPGQGRVGRLALAGVYAGFAVSRMGVDTVASQVVVRRLDTGQTLHAVSATTHSVGPEFVQAVEVIVVKPGGAVAWIARAGSIIRHASRMEVDRVDRRGEATLDSSANSALGSLQLRGSRLSWRHGTALRTSTLL